MSYILPTDEEVKTQFQKPNTNKTSFTIPNGGTNIFICPPSSTTTHKAVFYEIFKHEKMDNGFFEVCIGKDKCPICMGNNELWDYIKKTGKNEKLKADARSISSQIFAKNAFVYNVISDLKITSNDVFHSSDVPNEEPMIKSWLVSPKVHANIEQLTAFARSALFNPVCATILKVTKKSNGTYKDGPLAGQPIYVTDLAPAATNVKLNAQLMQLLSNIPDLSKVYKHKSVEELKTIVDNKLGAWRSEKNLTVVSMSVCPVTVPNIPTAQGTATVMPAVMTLTTMGVVPTVIPPNFPANTSIEVLEAQLAQSKG